MQPNKSILLKAVDAANNSTSYSSSGKTSATRSIADEKLEQIRSRRLADQNRNNNLKENISEKKIELFSENYRRNNNMEPSSGSFKRLKTHTEHTDRHVQIGATETSQTDTRMVQIESNESSSKSQETKPG